MSIIGNRYFQKSQNNRFFQYKTITDFKGFQNCSPTSKNIKSLIDFSKKKSIINFKEIQKLPKFRKKKQIDNGLLCIHNQ